MTCHNTGPPYMQMSDPVSKTSSAFPRLQHTAAGININGDTSTGIDCKNWVKRSQLCWPADDAKCVACAPPKQIHAHLPSPHTALTEGIDKTAP